MYRTDEQERLIKQGDDAEALLNTPAFQNVLNALVEGTFQQFVNTKPDESSARENLYNHYRALVDVANTLKQQTAIRDQIMESTNKEGDSSQEEE